jgi:cell division protein ZapD
VQKVIYEQPLNERIRTFMRLEHLFEQAQHTLGGQSVWDNRATLSSVLDILTIVSRSDLKTEVIKELERHNITLNRLEESPGVDRQRLAGLLEELSRLIKQLTTTSGRVGQRLQQSEFLTSIRQRGGIPGGAFDFDLPVYHFWLQRPAEERLQDLQGWLAEFGVLRQSIQLILSLIRGSAISKHETAQSGFYQQSLGTNAPYQMVRVAVNRDIPCYAEISGGKHRFSIRFMEPQGSERPVQTSRNVDFELTCCVI